MDPVQHRASRAGMAEADVLEGDGAADGPVRDGGSGCGGGPGTGREIVRRAGVQDLDETFAGGGGRGGADDQFAEFLQARDRVSDAVPCGRARLVRKYVGHNPVIQKGS
ncbi:hypothetical protein ABZ619_13565 [Streptomyces sp. NPDC007851]|uniref:hypothetical protein n=1 Tax=Streptomyces sp. NPDC007851 TaxID=3155008 RepID=UPI003400D132